jgi:hypothetical protein
LRLTASAAPALIVMPVPPLPGRDAGKTVALDATGGRLRLSRALARLSRRAK